MQNATLFRSTRLHVAEYHCTRGPADPAFAEQHECCALALVLGGSFGYEARGERHDLVAGSLLVGAEGAEYRCTHEHSRGDECLSFHFDAELVASLPLPTSLWQVGSLPPLAQTASVGALARASIAGSSSVGLDEVGLFLVHALARARRERKPAHARLASRDRRRAVEAASWIEAHCTEPLDLARSAAHAELSPYHFLRLFSRVLGVTPHQHLVRARLRLAAEHLAASDAPITSVALECGFQDLSNFVRTFHRAADMSPRVFRKLARGERKILQERLARFA